MQSLLPSAATIGEHIALYREHMAEAPAPLDANPAFGEVDVVRMTYVAPTDARAREESEAGITRHMKSFLGGAVGSYLGDVAEKADESQFAYEHLVKDTILHGSPDTVLRKIELFRNVRRDLADGPLSALLRRRADARHAAPLRRRGTAGIEADGHRRAAAPRR